MQPMTADEFKELRFQQVDPFIVDRLTAALKEREELLKARRLLLAGPVGDEPNLQDAEMGEDSHYMTDRAFRCGIEAAVEWAQGLFDTDERRPCAEKTEASHATNDVG